jgi:hypothetical protein
MADANKFIWIKKLNREEEMVIKTYKRYVDLAYLQGKKYPGNGGMQGLMSSTIDMSKGSIKLQIDVQTIVKPMYGYCLIKFLKFLGFLWVGSRRSNYNYYISSLLMDANIYTAGSKVKTLTEFSGLVQY